MHNSASRLCCLKLIVGLVPMKILHVAQSLKGGPASYFDEIIPHQIQRYGAENVVLLIPADDLQYLSTATLAATIRTFPTRNRSAIALWQFAAAFVRSQRQAQPNIVHLHSTYAGAIGRLANVFRRRRPLIVYCAHGWAFERNDGKKGLGQALVVTIERTLAAITDRVINLSESDQLKTDQLGIARGRSLVIKNAIAARDLPTQVKPERREAMGLRPEVTNLLFVGRLDKQKGVDILIELMNSLEGMPFHLSMIGQRVTDGDHPDIPFPDNVTHLGWIHRQDVLGYYDACDVLIMPSRWEGMPITLLEAMRSGLPAVTSNRSALPYVVLDRISGRVSPELTAAAFKEILLTTTGTEWAEYGIAARMEFEANYNADKLCSALDEMYENLLLENLKHPYQVVTE